MSFLDLWQPLVISQWPWSKEGLSRGRSTKEQKNDAGDEPAPLGFQIKIKLQSYLYFSCGKGTIFFIYPTQNSKQSFKHMLVYATAIVLCSKAKCWQNKHSYCKTY